MRKQREWGVDSFEEQDEVKWWSAVGLFALGALAVGCTKAWMSENRLAATGLGPQDAITVILVQRPGDEYSAGLESKVAGCVRNALQQIHSSVRIVPHDEFRQAAFSDPSLKELPQDDSSWQRLVGDPKFLERIAPLEVRYLIAVAVQEGRGPIDLHGGGAGSGGAGIGAIGVDWDRWAEMQATIMDMMHARVAGNVSSRARGKSAVGLAVFIILPIPYGKPSFPLGTACWELGEGVAKFLAGESVTKP